MERKYLELTKKVSAVNIVYFKIFPSENDFNLDAEDKNLIDEFLSAYSFSENCIHDVFENDILFATTIVIYLYKILSDNTLKYRERLFYLSPLQKIICSFLKSDKLDEKTVKKFEEENQILVKDLMFARFALLYGKFNDNYDDFFFEPSDNIGFIRCRDKLKELSEEEINNELLFNQLFELSKELKSANYLLRDFVPFYRQIKFFLLNKGCALLSEFIALVRAIMISQNDLFPHCDNSFDAACRLRDNLRNLLSVFEKANALTRFLWLESEYELKKDEKARLAGKLIELYEYFDDASRKLDIVSRKYNFDYRYEIKYRIEIDYFNIFKSVYFNFQYNIDSEESQQPPYSFDKIRSYSLAFLKFTSDTLSVSWPRGLLIANFCLKTKILANVHFEYIRNDIDSDYQTYINKMFKFLTYFARTQKSHDFFKCNPLFKEIYLDYILSHSDCENAKTIIYLNEDYVDIDTLFIVRKYKPQKYKNIVEKISENCKKQISETLKSNDLIYKIYGKEFCDELYKMCV